MKNSLRSLDVSEMIVSSISTIYLDNALFEFFLSCSIKNLTYASVSRLFTTKSDVILPFYKFYTLLQNKRRR